MVVNSCAMARVMLAASERHPCHGGDGGQRLAAEPIARYSFKVIETGNLAGGVARQCQREVVNGDAVAVVGAADQAHAALLQLHVYFCGAGIEAVLDQFLQHRRRPLDHFAGGDLADQQVGQGMDAGHAMDY